MRLALKRAQNGAVGSSRTLMRPGRREHSNASTIATPTERVWQKKVARSAGALKINSGRWSLTRIARFSQTIPKLAGYCKLTDPERAQSKLQRTQGFISRRDIAL